jgi:hypothetical protein
MEFLSAILPRYRSGRGDEAVNMEQENLWR